MSNAPLYFALALVLGYLALVSVFSFWRKRRKQKKHPPKRDTVDEKHSPNRQFSDERFRLNLMAIEAAHQMVAAAVRSSKTD